MDTKSAAANNPTAESTPSDADIQPELEKPRDFDGSAGEFWELFNKEAKSHDKARIYALKEDMGGELIFVRSYSVRAYYRPGHADAWLHRLVYFPLPSQRSYSTANKIYRSIPQMKWSITSDNTQPSFLKFPCN